MSGCGTGGCLWARSRSSWLAWPVSPNDYLYQPERGKKLPTLPVLVTLARVLQVPLDHLTDDHAVAVARPPAHHDDDLYLAPTYPSAADLPSVDATTLQQQVRELWRLWQAADRAIRSAELLEYSVRLATAR